MQRYCRLRLIFTQHPQSGGWAAQPQLDPVWAKQGKTFNQDESGGVQLFELDLDGSDTASMIKYYHFPRSQSVENS